ncbi:MAG TPA: hypothetical protein VHE83_14750 [Mycobacteriales bacterium]|nr:hypothetical protein [Mycobacteriales bacterium]
MPDRPIPDELTGGWERVTIAIGDAEPHEDCLVWWLQAPSRHADLRIPTADSGRPLCFAGTTSWKEPSLTWTPAVTLEPSDGVDTGVISWDGDDLLEAGTFATDAGPVRYVERWRRLPGSDVPLLALERDDGRIVRAGPYALTLLDTRPGGAFLAVAWRLRGDRWVEEHRWPPDSTATAASPPTEMPKGITIVLDDARVWVVVEAVS